MKNYTCVLAGLAVSPLFAAAARAAMVINLRFADGSTTHALTAADVGHDMEIDVWASITGNNPPSPTNFYGLQYLYYSVVSALPQGAGTGVQGGIDANANTLTPDFGGTPTALGAQIGVTQDINGDGVADVGARTVSAITSMSKPRSAPGGIWSDTTGPGFDALPDGYEFEVEKLFFHVNSSASGETDFTAEIEDTGPYVAANWWQDASNTQTPNVAIQTGPYSGGTTVRLVAAVPEPGSVAMMLGVGGLLMRRRRGLLNH